MSEFFIKDNVLRLYFGNDEQVKVPEGIVEIYDHAFNYCYKLKRVILPESLTLIGIEAFKDCTALEQVDIPNAVTVICRRAFYGCTALERVSLPSELTLIADGAFESCTELKSVVIPDKVRRIGEGSFRSCTGLERIVFPKSLESIENYAFNICNSLEEVELFDGLKKIGNQAFHGCKKLRQIIIPKTVEKMGSDAFQRSFAIKRVINHSKLSLIEKYNYYYLKTPTYDVEFFYSNEPIENIPESIRIVAVETYVSRSNEYPTDTKKQYAEYIKTHGGELIIMAASRKKHALIIEMLEKKLITERAIEDALIKSNGDAELNAVLLEYRHKYADFKSDAQNGDNLIEMLEDSE